MSPSFHRRILSSGLEGSAGSHGSHACSTRIDVLFLITLSWIKAFNNSSISCCRDTSEEIVLSVHNNVILSAEVVLLHRRVSVSHAWVAVYCWLGSGFCLGTFVWLPTTNNKRVEAFSYTMFHLRDAWTPAGQGSVGNYVYLIRLSQYQNLKRNRWGRVLGMSTVFDLDEDPVRLPVICPKLWRWCSVLPRANQGEYQIANLEAIKRASPYTGLLLTCAPSSRARFFLTFCRVDISIIRCNCQLDWPSRIPSNTEAMRWNGGVSSIWSHEISLVWYLSLHTLKHVEGHALTRILDFVRSIFSIWSVLSRIDGVICRGRYQRTSLMKWERRLATLHLNEARISFQICFSAYPWPRYFIRVKL